MHAPTHPPGTHACTHAFTHTEHAPMHALTHPPTLHPLCAHMLGVRRLGGARRGLDAHARNRPMRSQAREAPIYPRPRREEPQHARTGVDFRARALEARLERAPARVNPVKHQRRARHSSATTAGHMPHGLTA